MPDLAMMTARIRERSGSERMGGQASPMVFELGYEVRTNGKELGGMVAGYFADEQHLVDIIPAVVQLWREERVRARGNVQLPRMLSPNVAWQVIDTPQLSVAICFPEVDRELLQVGQMLANRWLDYRELRELRRAPLGVATRVH